MKTTYVAFLIAGAMIAASAAAQDSMLGKKRGGGTSPAPASSPSRPAPQSSASPSSQNGSRSPAQRSDSRTAQSTTQTSNLLQRRPQSRSGQVNYGTVNNLWRRQDMGRAPQIQRAPTVNEIRTRNSMGDQIRREDRVRVDYSNGGLRIGYYQRDQRWRDDQFCYPYYVFSPYTVQTCVASPWYYYPSLPPYVQTYRTSFAGDFTTFFGSPYEWQPSRYRSRDYYDDDNYGWYDSDRLDRRDLDYAIDDIVDAFERQDRRAVDRLVPRNGNVTLMVDSTITYGVNADDFYDMLMDAVMSSDTRDYEILSVKTNNNEAEVLARHEYLDPWGQRQSVYHRLRLREERGHAVIRYFGTTQNPNW